MGNFLNVNLMRGELGAKQHCVEWGAPGSPVVLAIPVKNRTHNLDTPVFPSNLVLIAEALQNIINVYISIYESKLVPQKDLSFLPLCIVTQESQLLDSPRNSEVANM